LRKNFLLKEVTEGQKEGRIEVTRRLGRRHTQLLDDLKEKRGYGKMKGETLARILWRTCFGREYGLVVRHCRVNK
jgi:hypothetical protein